MTRRVNEVHTFVVARISDMKIQRVFLLTLAKKAKLDADIRTSPSLGTRSIQNAHNYYLFALEDEGRSAPMAGELVDRLAILAEVRRFPSLGAGQRVTLVF
jgi:hypothetical protein